MVIDITGLLVDRLMIKCADSVLSMCFNYYEELCGVVCVNSVFSAIDLRDINISNQENIEHLDTDLKQTIRTIAVLVVQVVLYS